jgi:hypothetical protein
LSRQRIRLALQPTPRRRGINYDVARFRHSDFVAEFEVDFDGYTASGSYIALEYRSNGTTGYRLMLKNEASGKLRLETMAGTTVQDGTGVAMTSGVAMRIKVAVSGTTHKAWLNGELQVNVTDATYASGTQLAFVGKNCTGDVRLFHVRSGDALTVHGLGAGEQIWLRTHGELPVDTVTANGSGIATYTGTHYPISRVQGSAGDQRTSDGLLWGGDDLTYPTPPPSGGLYDPAIYDGPSLYDTGATGSSVRGRRNFIDCADRVGSRAVAHF